jgi:hypothetical protein
VTYISGAHDTADLFHRVKVGTQTTVHCENLFVDDCCNGQAVEAICESLPELDIVSSLALIVEAIDTVDGGAFVVAAQDEEVLGVFDLVGKKEADCLKRLLASIDIVSKEEIVCLRGEAAIFEQTKKIIILAMYITTNLWSHDNGQHIVM